MGKSLLCQIISICNTKKKEAVNDLTKLYQGLSKTDQLSGISRNYKPLDDDGEKFPSESKLVQVNVSEVLDRASKVMSDMFDVVLTQDRGNTVAKANIEVDGTVILGDVPVTSLLFLEKQLTDIHTVFSSLPVLPPETTWAYDKNRGCYVSQEVQTAKSKKIPFRFEKAPATDKHPAQVEILQEDRLVGYWSKVDFSGAVSAEHKAEYVNRVRKLRDAVVKAREKANQTEIDNVKAGENIFGYLLAPV
jgi:hypothetical protein